jgi:hypothetical protein
VRDVKLINRPQDVVRWVSIANEDNNFLVPKSRENLLSSY